MHGSWVISRGEKKLLTCSLYEERTRWKRWQFFVKFDFSIGFTIIVETNKKVELFPWTGEVQTVIWIAKCINTFFATEFVDMFPQKEDVIGTYEWKGKLDLINIIMVGLAKKLPGHSETDY